MKPVNSSTRENLQYLKTNYLSLDMENNKSWQQITARPVGGGGRYGTFL